MCNVWINPCSNSVDITIFSLISLFLTLSVCDDKPVGSVTQCFTCEYEVEKSDDEDENARMKKFNEECKKHPLAVANKCAEDEV